MSEDRAILDQLPLDVQDRLYCQFIFKDFLESFQEEFRIQKVSTKGEFLFGAGVEWNIRSYYTFEDQQYRLFIINLLENIEPIYFNQNERIIDELDEFNEVLFIQKGKIGIGFEMNRITWISLQKEKAVIGDYGVTFNQRSNFIYHAITECEGQFVRKAAWKQLIESYPEIGEMLRGRVLTSYILKIRAKVNAGKTRQLKKIYLR